jgi:hypothetical protein
MRKGKKKNEEEGGEEKNIATKHNLNSYKESH